jgi:PTH1 family peptidyl-tRNA hydrolase
MMSSGSSARQHESTSDQCKAENKITLVVGLGNVGEEYDRTRHNVGFLVADELARISGAQFSYKKKFKAEIAELNLSNGKLIIIKPSTYMNKSGDSVSVVANFFKPRKIVVAHDDADLPFGDIRVRESGSSAGHNGVGSIITQLGENFTRVRIGIGRPSNNIPLEDWVLGKWNDDETSRVHDIVLRAAETVRQNIGAF